MDIFEEIKARVNVRELLESYGIYPVRGKNIYRCCFHSPDKNPSAHITRDEKRFKCFACGCGGDIFDIVQHLEQCDRKEAMRIIDNKFNLGIYGNLSHKEKLELARKQRERERLKAEQLAWEQFERETLNEIVKWLRFWEQVQLDTHITRGEYRKGEWKYKDLFFYSLKCQEWLNWLYDVICEFNHPDCAFDYIYGTDKKTILKAIKQGEIFIWLEKDMNEKK